MLFLLFKFFVLALLLPPLHSAVVHTSPYFIATQSSVIAAVRGEAHRDSNELVRFRQANLCGVAVFVL